MGQKLKILLCSGGTGGHMSPAASLALDLISRGFDVALMTDKRGMKYEAMFGSIPKYVVKSGTLQKGLVGKIKGVSSLGIGYFQARNTLRKYKPSVVVGFGGYPSVPGVYAAQKDNIPTIIHEQNAVIGKANALLAQKADRIALSIQNEEGLHKDDMMRAIIVGNPVRPDIAALYNKPYPSIEQDGVMRILVVGGSLGARVFSEVVPKALDNLAPHHKTQLEITQQCREEDMESAKKTYEKANIKVNLMPFVEDMAQALEHSHLVIARSGASTVAEVSAAGRPAIFVPYPHHKDMQQMRNAEAVADAGGAWVMSEEGFKPEALLARIETFLQNPETLFRAAEKARLCGRPDAARKLGNLVTALAKGWDE